jgi:DNA-binding NarL/FixJ family response regulator
MRVLLIDDHAVVRRSLAHFLNAEGVEVIGEAGNGKDGITLTRQFHPDVILMDIHMPVMDGIEATQIIHAEFPDIRIIGLSMFESAEQIDALRAAGAVGYVGKVEAPETLLAALRGDAAALSRGRGFSD